MSSDFNKNTREVRADIIDARLAEFGDGFEIKYRALVSEQIHNIAVQMVAATLATLIDPASISLDKLRKFREADYINAFLGELQARIRCGEGECNLEEELMRYSREQFNAFVLCDLCGFSRRKAANILRHLGEHKVTEQAVKDRLTRARNFLGISAPKKKNDR